MTPDPRPGAAFWAEVFGRVGPVEIEIGCGDGRFLLATARRRPGVNLLGMEWSGGKARRLVSRLARLALPGVRVLRADATCVVSRVIPDASVAGYHVYFPDPWPKRRHAPRRLFSPAMVAALARTLEDGGRLYVATDVGPYLEAITRAVLAHGAFAAEPVDDTHPGLDTGFARKYRAAGRPLYPATFARSAARGSPRAAASNTRSA